MRAPPARASRLAPAGATQYRRPSGATQYRGPVRALASLGEREGPLMPRGGSGRRNRGRVGSERPSNARRQPVPPWPGGGRRVPCTRLREHQPHTSASLAGDANAHTTQIEKVRWFLAPATE
jgi:hypothetical protein